MNRKAKKIVAFIIAVTMVVLSLAACGNSTDTADSTASTSTAAATSAVDTKPAAPEPVTLQFFVPPAQAPNDMDAVLAEFEKQTKDTLNTKIVFNWVDFPDLGSTITVKLAAGEQVDSAFSAQWTTPNIQQNVSKGLFLNLDSYFLNDKYPGLKNAFSKQLLDNNAWTDANNETHYYSIPFAHSYSAVETIAYRQDLADKYGIGVIDSFDKLEAYWEQIAKNEKGVIPFGWDGSINNLSDRIFSWYMPLPSKHNYNIDNLLVVKEDGTAYRASHPVAMLDPEYVKNLPDELKSFDPYFGYKKATEWYTKGYLEKDVLTQKDARSAFNAGKFASALTSADTYDADKSKLESGVPGAKFGYFTAHAQFRENKPGKFGADYRAWNFACIPVTSQYADRTMNFFNWLFEDKKNHDLFEFGIEGKHWIADGEDKLKIPEGIDASKNYNLVGFQLTWSSAMQRFSSTMPDEIVNLNKIASDPNFFYKDVMAGFSFVSDPVKSEQAKINDLDSRLRGIKNGVIANYEKALSDIQKKYISAGFEKYNAEYVKQFNEFLKTNPYNGQ